jgi:hypothetical protein
MRCSLRQHDIHLFLPLLWIVSACATTHQKSISAADIRPLPFGVTEGDHPRPIPGIRDALEKSRGSGTPVRILTVHGMLTSAPGFDSAWQKNIGDRLGLVPGDSTLIEITRGYTVTAMAGEQPFTIANRTSQLRTKRWVSPDNRSKPVVVFYELLWAPFRDVVKDRFIACFEDAVPPRTSDCAPTKAAKNPDKHYAFNRMGKEDLLVGGFADASILLSPLGDVFRDDVDLAMCRISADILAEKKLAPAVPEDRRCQLARPGISSNELATWAQSLSASPFFVISHSLGGFLVLDGQQRAERAKQSDSASLRTEALSFALMDNATMFMFANQISLLELGRLSVHCDPAAGYQRCPSGLFADSARIAPLSKMTNYVAFNDVNDLLTFELPPYLAETGYFGTLVNVSVRNPAKRYFGVLEHPGNAHVTYGENAAVIKAVVEGIPIKSFPIK